MIFLCFLREDTFPGMAIPPLPRALIHAYEMQDGNGRNSEVYLTKFNQMQF